MANMQTVLLEKPSQINLAKHGVIEAHAGTGKTYTIVQLVLRLLKGEAGRKPVHIRDLLLVTYTDKAAGELKERIREGLVKEIAAQPNEHLNDCLSNMGEALIGTIHSVCLRILRMWPFETGVHFQTQMVHDQHGIEDAFYELIRKDWNDPQSKLHAVIPKLDGGIQDKHCDAVKRLALQLLDDHTVVLDRSEWKGLTLENYDERLAAEVAEETRIWASVQERVEGFQKCIHTLANLPDCEDSLRSVLLNKVCEVDAMLQQKTLKGWSSLTKANGKELILKSGPFYKQNTALCQQFRETWPAEIKASIASAKEALSGLVSARELIDLLFVAESAERLAGIWRQKKAEQGLISFNDMLRSTHRAVLSNPLLVHQIRERVTYGIIDEFQDTSVLQWQIFREIFLHGGEGKLFIVGDPKQSIYAFQGADVGSYTQARNEILANGGILYGLVYNYRSLPNVIHGYNAIVGKDEDKEDWFTHTEIRYPGEGPGGQMALVPKRQNDFPKHARSTVTVIPLQGKTDARRREMVEHTLQIIRSLCGTSVVLPKGDGWEERKLTLRDFAIIVEQHHLGDAYLERFAEAGVFAAKYKMDGVFQSQMCLALRTVLLAIGDSSHPQKLAALLTPFFQKHPAEIDPEKDLGIDSPLMKCLRALSELAQHRRWGLLFEEMLDQTMVEATLARLGDGERQIADLRQVIDYCIEKLVQNSWALRELCDHLLALIEEREDAGQDQNLFNLASERDAVQVLTMHASKGLEFPVVFLELAKSERSERNIVIRQWNDGGTRYVFPTKSGAPGWDDHIASTMQAEQERRRLLYVALTRPKAMLFVPAHFDSFGDAANFAVATESDEKDLSMRLKTLMVEGRLQIFNPCDYELHQDSPGSETLDHLQPDFQCEPDSALLDRLHSLEMTKRYSLQTSYTELSHGMEVDREVYPSAELDAVPKEYKDSALPRGKNTGDALHKAIEYCIQTPAWKDMDLKKVVQEQLQHLVNLDEEKKSKAIEVAERMVRQSMLCDYDLGERWGKISLATLPQGHCRAELEFQLAEGVDWLHGFMDVVFRIPDASNAKHPWRYFVLDWKSNSLSDYTLAQIEKSIFEDHYNLQAHVYSYALHCFLKGLLGTDYMPEANLGGAVYVYLRAFEYQDSVPVWMHLANPEQDGEFVATNMKHWKQQKCPWTI